MDLAFLSIAVNRYGAICELIAISECCQVHCLVVDGNITLLNRNFFVDNSVVYKNSLSDKQAT
jgi:hypothetical protein